MAACGGACATGDGKSDVSDCEYKVQRWLGSGSPAHVRRSQGCLQSCARVGEGFWRGKGGGWPPYKSSTVYCAPTVNMASGSILEQYEIRSLLRVTGAAHAPNVIRINCWRNQAIALNPIQRSMGAIAMLQQLRLDKHRTSLTTIFGKPQQEKGLGVFRQLGKQALRQRVHTNCGRKVLLIPNLEEIQ